MERHSKWSLQPVQGTEARKEKRWEESKGDREGEVKG